MPPFWTMDHRDDTYEQIRRGIVRVSQQGTAMISPTCMRFGSGCLSGVDFKGFDMATQILRRIVLFILQLPQMIDTEARQALLSGEHEAIKFVIEHERLLALILFVLSYMKIFGTILNIIFFIPRHISLVVLWCLGFRRDGIEDATFASSYQSRNYVGNVLPNSPFSRCQSIGAARFRVPVNEELVSWVFWIASICLYADYLYRQQA
ncbi:hypothetical protein F5887DRAFT_1076976 [Amanita rubescens]|nr:hypothetical protein F5887DRAFT_1076976 [Amanita rubescens]